MKKQVTKKPEEAPIAERKEQLIFAARSVRIGAGMCDVLGRALPSSVVSMLFSYLSPSDIVHLHCVSKKFRALLRSPRWMELVILFSIPLNQWRPIHGRYGKPDWRERKLNLGQDPTCPNRGRLLLTYKMLLSEEVDLDDDDAGYSIDEKKFSFLTQKQYCGTWHSNVVEPLAIGDGWIPFREIYVQFSKLYLAEFFHSPPSKLSSISVNESSCNLRTVLRFSATSKGKLKITGYLPDSASRLEKEEIALRPRPSMSIPHDTAKESQQKDKKGKEETEVAYAGASTLVELINAMRESMEEAQYVEPNMGVPKKHKPPLL